MTPEESPIAQSACFGQRHSYTWHLNLPLGPAYDHPDAAAVALGLAHHVQTHTQTYTMPKERSWKPGKVRMAWEEEDEGRGRVRIQERDAPGTLLFANTLDDAMFFENLSRLL